MAFISMIFAFAVLLLGLFSFIGLVVSVVLAIVFARKKTKSAKIVKTVACVFICLCVVGMLPVKFILGFGLVTSATVPEDFVDVEITAEITDDGFVTSDCRAFKKLPYTHNDIEKNEACFAVKPEGFFRRNEWRNVYSFTADGKTLYICTRDFYGAIYCEAECWDETLRYFAENCHWVQEFPRTPCSAEAVAIIEKYKAMDGAVELKFPDTYMYLEETRLECLSADDVICTDESAFVKCAGRYYIYTYYVYGEYIRCYGFELTAEEAETAEKEFFANYEE